MWRTSDRRRPIFIGEPLLLCLIAGVALWLGWSREAPLALIAGLAVAVVAALSVLGWFTAAPRRAP